jgi:hypothetical protein
MILDRTSSWVWPISNRAGSQWNTVALRHMMGGELQECRDGWRGRPIFLACFDRWKLEQLLLSLLYGFWYKTWQFPVVNLFSSPPNAKARWNGNCDVMFVRYYLCLKKLCLLLQNFGLFGMTLWGFQLKLAHLPAPKNKLFFFVIIITIHRNELVCLQWTKLCGVPLPYGCIV